MTARVHSALTATELREHLSYDPETGHFQWRHRRPGVTLGVLAGYIDTDGYRRIKLNYRKYHASVLAWLYVDGQWPEGYVDHKNLNRSDDRWANLRLATVSQSNTNRRGWSTRKSGTMKGVYKKRNGWEATIQCNGKAHYLGRFKTEESAHAAYAAASSKLHGEFGRIV